MNPTKEKLKKIHTAMYNVNRQISRNYIALKRELQDKAMTDLNRFIGEWIKQLRDIEEEMK